MVYAVLRYVVRSLTARPRLSCSAVKSCVLSTTLCSVPSGERATDDAVSVSSSRKERGA